MTQVVPWRAGLALSYMAGIVWLSSLSGSEPAWLGILGLPSEVGHTVLFAGLSAVTFWSLVGPRPRCALLAALICLVFAVSDEWHQHFVPGRVPSLEDVVADGVGIMLGVAFASALPLLWRAQTARATLPKGGLEP